MIAYEKSTTDAVSPNFKYLKINGSNQQFEIGQRVNDEWDDDSVWENNNIIKSGYNTIKIEKRGANHYYYINGTKVSSEYYSNKTGGYFGFGGGSTSNHDIKPIIYFDYYRVNLE